MATVIKTKWLNWLLSEWSLPHHGSLLRLFNWEAQFLWRAKVGPETRWQKSVNLPFQLPKTSISGFLVSTAPWQRQSRKKWNSFQPKPVSQSFLWPPRCPLKIMWITVHKGNLPSFHKLSWTPTCGGLCMPDISQQIKHCSVLGEFIKKLYTTGPMKLQST